MSALAERVAHHSRQDATQMCATLREVEYWRRLVAARLDLAIACVTAAPEPDPWSLLATGATPPRGGLRRLVGLDGDQLREVAALDQLRDTLTELQTSVTRLRAAHPEHQCTCDEVPPALSGTDCHR